MAQVGSTLLKLGRLEHDTLIEQCLKGQRKAQKELFDLYSGKMYYLCLRYAVDESEAQDMLQEGFVRLFKNLQSFPGKGSFEGWVRRIFVHTAIKYYHKMRKHNLEMTSVDISPESLKQYDLVLISTNHSSYDYAVIAANSKLIVDTRGAMRGIAGDQDHIVSA